MNILEECQVGHIKTSVIVVRYMMILKNEHISTLITVL